jgi:heme-degrading monooxygenase HmoA
LPSVEQKETHYQPGTQEEATSLLRDVMLPKARELQGFKGALILNDAVMNTGITITLWETEADLEASQPPDAIMEAIERLGLLLTEQTTRGVYTDSTSSQYTQPIRTRLRGRTSRDRIELPRNAIRVIEADVLAMGPWIFLHSIVGYPCRI